MAKHIFVTGGVVSSLGKGLTCASIGMLLEHRGLRVRLQKFDPYINVDPGTMSPYQHGEVYVLDDGAETDLDLGHYERFTNAPLDPRLQLHHRQDLPVGHREGAAAATTWARPSRSSRTSPTRSRRRSASWPTDDVDVVITEIGGTVGDIEGLPFLEAIRQFALDVGKQNCLYIHLTLVPYLKAAGELKTKPTQHSRRALCGRSASSRTSSSAAPSARSPEDDATRSPCSATSSGGRSSRRRDKEFSIYEVPLSLVDNGLDELIVEKLGLQGRRRSTSPTGASWSTGSCTPTHEVTIAVVGKYIKHHDAYKSVYESLDHAGIAHRARVGRPRIEAEEVERRGGRGGPGRRRRRARPRRLRHARASRARSRRSASPARRGIPFFGICLGLQCAVDRVRPQRARPGGRQQHRVRQATASTRSSACSTSSTPSRTAGGTMRLGACARATCAEAAWRTQAYGADVIQRAAPAPLRVQQRTTASSSRRTAWSSPARAPTASWSR